MICLEDAREKLLKERCKILGVDFDPKLMDDPKLRRKFYKQFSRKKSREKKAGKLNIFMNSNDLDKKTIEQQEEIFLGNAEVKEKLPTEKLLINGDKLSINGRELKISACMSEGLTFTNKQGEKQQAPEITVTFKRSFDFKDMGVMQTSREMASGKRPINKSVNSILVDNIGNKTIYPNSFEMAIDHLNKNFGKRLAKYFGFNVNFSELSKSRMKKVFERAFTGTRLMTTVCEVGSA